MEAAEEVIRPLPRHSLVLVPEQVLATPYEAQPQDPVGTHRRPRPLVATRPARLPRLIHQALVRAQRTLRILHQCRRGRRMLVVASPKARPFHRRVPVVLILPRRRCTHPTKMVPRRRSILRVLHPTSSRLKAMGDRYRNGCKGVVDGAKDARDADSLSLCINVVCLIRISRPNVV
jgi:hypothetical protein